MIQALTRCLVVCYLIPVLVALGSLQSAHANEAFAYALVKNEQDSHTLRFNLAKQCGRLQNPSINEASGMAASRKNIGVLWVHNDSGDAARIYAMTVEGKHLGTYSLNGVTAADCEDIAIGPGPVNGKDYIYLGDIGDNNATRGTIRIYRVEEPVVSPDQQPVETVLNGVDVFTLRYEDGPRDAETLMVDPRTGDIYVVSKREMRSRVYRAAATDLRSGGVKTLHFEAELPWGGATGGDISPRGDEVLIRGYSRASIWKRTKDSPLWSAFSGREYRVPLASEPQGEAIAFDRNGLGYYTVSEGRGSPIYYFSRADLSESSNQPACMDYPTAGRR